METNKMKHFSRQSVIVQNRQNSKLYRLSSFAQLTNAFNLRQSYVKPKTTDSAGFESIRMDNFISPPTYESPSRAPRQSVPNFSLPISSQSKQNMREKPGRSQACSLLPRSSTFSHFPTDLGVTISHPHASNNKEISQIRARASNKPKLSSSGRSLLPVRTCPSATNDLISQRQDWSRASKLPSGIRPSGSNSACGANQTRSILAIRTEEVSTQVEFAKTCAHYHLPDTDSSPQTSTFEPLDYFERTERRFNSSAYWTGRFVALNDVYMNEYWRNQKVFDVDGDKRYLLLDVIRCRVVFDALESLCLTDEAQNDLKVNHVPSRSKDSAKSSQQFRLQYATIKNMPELIGDTCPSLKLLTEVESQRTNQQSSSASSNENCAEQDMEDALAPSSVSTASTKSYNQMPLNYRFPLNLDQITSTPDVRIELSAGHAPSPPHSNLGQSPPDLYKTKRVSFIEKLIAKSRRGSTIHT